MSYLDDLHPHDKLPLFDRAKRVIQYLRQAAERGEWQAVSPPQEVQDLLSGKKIDPWEENAGETKARLQQRLDVRFGHALTVPFESSYTPGQGGNRNGDIEHLIDYAVTLRNDAPPPPPTKVEGVGVREVKIGGEVKRSYGNCGKPGNGAGGFTLYTNHPDVFPFHALEQRIDQLRQEVGKDWKIQDGKLVRDFPLIGRDFFVMEHFIHRNLGMDFMHFPKIEFLKDGKVVHNPYPLKNRASVFEALMTDACGIKDIQELPWDDGMQFFKFIMSMGPTSAIPADVADKLMTMVLAIAEQKGISARITISDPWDIEKFGKEVSRDFLGKAR
jgi:hypothetical protein